MSAESQFSLCWDNYQESLLAGMQSMLETEDMVDVTIAVEGKLVKAHKMVLSLCSSYFKEIFNTNSCKHPVIYMYNVSYKTLQSLLTFMYRGVVEVEKEQLQSFIKTAEALQIKGLTDDKNKQDDHIIHDIKKEFDESSSNKKRSDIVYETRVVVESETENCIADEGIISMDTSMQIDDGIEFKNEETVAINENNFKAGSSTQTVENADYIITVCEAGSLNYNIPLSAPKTSKKRNTARTRYVHKGFVYHNKVIAGTPPIRYLACAEIKRNGCRARAIIPVDASIDKIRVTKPHNHPPDINAEEKLEFLEQLKVAAKSMNGSLKSIYDNIALIYPQGAQEISFKSICSSLHRWRKSALQNN